MTVYHDWDIDWNKAQPGDIIDTGREVTYIRSIEPRYNSNPRIIQPEVRIELEGYSHRFEWEHTPGAGYGFDCYKDGTLPEHPDFDIDWIKDQNIHTYKEYFEYVKAQPGLNYLGIEPDFRTIKEPAILQCDCGEKIELYMIMTNTCDKCESDYSISGQRLAPREQWGWDTGESLSDILNSDWSINEPTPGREEYDDE